MPTERTFIKELRVDFLRAKVGFWKIPDSILTPGQRFMPVRFFDVFVLHNSHFAAMEMKMVKAPRLEFNKIRQVQIDNLLLVESAGCPSYLVVNYRNNSIKVNTMLVWRIKDFIIQMEECLLRGKKSISLRSLDDLNCHKIERVRGQWQLEPLVQMITNHYGEPNVD